MKTVALHCNIMGYTALDSSLTVCIFNTTAIYYACLFSQTKSDGCHSNMINIVLSASGENQGPIL